MTNLHKAIISMHKSHGGHHDRLAKLAHSHAQACDGEDIHKSWFHRLADEHKAMAAHHRAAAAELAASPEVDDLSPRKARVAVFEDSDESDFDHLPVEIRKLVKAE